MLKVYNMTETKTRTFAEIYESQGHLMKALNIYIELLRDNPLDTALTDNIKRLQILLIEEESEKKNKAEEKISSLNNFLQKFYAYRTA